METNSIEMAVLPENKIVTNASVARKLIKDGYKIVDIKPKRNAVRESIFVFQVVPGFMEKMNEYVAEKKGRPEKRAD